MKKATSTAGFVAVLRSEKTRTDYRMRDIYSNVVIDYLAWYFESRLAIGDIPPYDRSIDNIQQYLVEYLDDAMNGLRVSTDPKIVEFRGAYEKVWEGRNVPNLTNIAYGGVDRVLAIQRLAHLMNVVTEETWLGKEVEQYFYAQDRVLDQLIHQFVRQVYRCGLFTLLEDSKVTGHSGEFGKTKLRSFETAGRVMFTFARPAGEMEQSFTIVGESGERMGVRFGPQSVYCDLRTATSMIQDVVLLWPHHVSEQKRVYLPDAKVTFA